MSVATVTELWRMSATELARAIRSKQASSREVVQAHLRRIEVVNPAVNAVTVVLGEQALEAAKAADRAVAAGGELPRFHGVPFTVKGNIDLVGTPTTHGARALENAYPSRDAPVVERLKAAGAIPIGRTNLPTFAMRWHCASELHGPTINPWDRSRTAGASSAGEAAALATGMSPLGLGNDGLGSLRHPAQCCGVSALKPTLGRIPDATTTGPQAVPVGVQLTSVQGPLARRIADLRAAFAVLAGPTWRDPWSVPAPLRGPEPAKPLRVALVVDPASQGTARQVQEGVRKAARALADAGYAVDEVEPPSIEVAAKVALDMLSTPGIRAGWQLAFPSVPADTRRFLLAFFEVAGDADPVTAEQGFMTGTRCCGRGGVSGDAPADRRPGLHGHPAPGGHRPGRRPGGRDDPQHAHGHRHQRAGPAGGGAPGGHRDGLPQAVQVIGPRYREDLCLDAAAALEDRVGVITPIDPRWR